VRQAFALTPEYLKTSEAEAGVRNLMDTGIQLGRRFRALKLWMILRHFGAEGLRAHARGAHAPRAAVRVLGRGRRSFRARRAGPLQRRLLPAARRSVRRGQRPRPRRGERVRRGVSSSHTKLDGRYVLRLAIGNLQTQEPHVRRALGSSSTQPQQCSKSRPEVSWLAVFFARTLLRGEHVMSVRKRLLTAVIARQALAAAPRPASADWTITPFVGWNTGGSADVNGSDGTTRTSKFEHKIDYGVSIAGMGKGAFGARVRPRLFAELLRERQHQRRRLRLHQRQQRADAMTAT
jgi:hypothetical protein